MDEIINYSEIEEKVLDIRGQKAILDRDIAELYGVETKRVNEAVANNPDKFPEGYIIALNEEEWIVLRSKISTLNTQGRGQYTKYTPKAFTEKGLYMLATILKSPVATQTTIAIVETFAKLRELNSVINQLPEVQDDKQQKSLLRRSNELITDIFVGNAFSVAGDEISVELNLPPFKVKRTLKREKQKDD